MNPGNCATMKMSLRRSDQNKRHEARDILGPVHEWFAEGFELPDLREAEALLDEIAGSPGIGLEPA